MFKNILLTDILDNLVDFFVRYQRKNRALQGCDKRWEHEVGARSFVGSDTETVFEDAIHNTADTEGGFDN